MRIVQPRDVAFARVSIRLEIKSRAFETTRLGWGFGPVRVFKCGSLLETESPHRALHPQPGWPIALPVPYDTSVLKMIGSRVEYVRHAIPVPFPPRCVRRHRKREYARKTDARCASKNDFGHASPRVD